MTDETNNNETEIPRGGGDVSGKSVTEPNPRGGGDVSGKSATEPIARGGGDVSGKSIPTEKDYEETEEYGELRKSAKS